jgi:hypothetical protein
MLLALLIPIALGMSLIASLIYTMNYRDSAYIDWPLTFALTAVISAFFLWYNRRDLKG